jgi:hypothetical protein
MQGFAITSIRSLRLGSLLSFVLLSQFAATPRARARMWSLKITNYMSTLPFHTFAHFLGLIYTVVNPMLAPTVLFYFCLNYVIGAYQNLYVFTRKFESGGRSVFLLVASQSAIQ